LIQYTWFHIPQLQTFLLNSISRSVFLPNLSKKVSIFCSSVAKIL
jgi:hypothetical protein